MSLGRTDSVHLFPSNTNPLSDTTVASSDQLVKKITPFDLLTNQSSISGMTSLSSRLSRNSSTGDCSETEHDMSDILSEAQKNTAVTGSLDAPPRRKSRTKDEKVCLVCGDRALGYNFNALTCESCKAFFRRNALKSNTVQCLFQGNCQIDMRTRRFCPHCRLIKCYNVGMKKDMILDDTERKARMQKVLENRKRKMKGGCEEIAAKVKEEPPEVDMLPDQSHSSLQEKSITLSEAMAEHSSDENRLIMPALVAEDYTKDQTSFRILTPVEHILFRDLSEAYASTLGELLGKEASLKEESYSTCNDLINNSTVAVKRLIKFIKRLEDFQKLSQEDQISALKACVLSSLVLRSSCFYNIERNSWITGSGEISTNVLKRSTGYSELHEIHTNFCRTLKAIVQDDKVLFALIQVICIFNPDSKEIREKCKMANLQDKYIILLKHYLEWKFSYTNARSAFAKLMVILADMKKTSDAHNSIILQANPSDIEPLMLEVLDLKGLVTDNQRA